MTIKLIDPENIVLMFFDWNGTLLDDADLTLESINQVLSYFKKPLITLEQYQNTFCLPLSAFYLQYGIYTEKNTKKEAKIFHDHYFSKAQNTALRKGAKELVKLLPELYIETVILSNHTTKGIEGHLERWDIKKFFENILANETINKLAKGYKKIDRLKFFLKNKNIDKNRIVIVGDTIEEIQIAKEVGIKSIAVGGGHCSKERLKKNKPDKFFNDLEEFHQFWRK